LPLDQRGEISWPPGPRRDATDHNLPSCIGIAVERWQPRAAKAVALLGQAKIPQVREFITKRMTAASKAAPASN